jgi:hypothetical protein
VAGKAVVVGGPRWHFAFQEFNCSGFSQSGGVVTRRFDRASCRQHAYRENVND